MQNDNTNVPPTLNQPTSKDVIQNAWSEAYRLMEIMREANDCITFKITEIPGCEENSDHHLVIVADGSREAAIIRTELNNEFLTRFLMLPGSVVKAIQNS